MYLFIGMYFIVKHVNDFEIQTQSQNFPDNPRISRDGRKHIFDQVQHKSACTVTEAGYLEIWL